MKVPKKKSDNKVGYSTVSLPSPLIDKVKERIKGTGMSSVSAYIAFILREILSAENKKELDKKEIEEVKKKLKNLGY
ncbi:MAG: CopG family transcriptional regulator [Nanoarchaeota archaeon]|nr:ribbon-helix-helix domain-containing protein [Nanoarchaeota archaeon]MBU1445597.1 ribbon-helix-helix domain-containing protein [Nanoarchaeota archaeon]MBU2420908.1 ribbon-helix-helix domain-containing protein [Nanoarchaeota archaeon]MBU2475289.1 ribbon-helix-helix domain-containing protein [Nanoarchaeota archaeon]